jgi:dTDP-4-dehydrorhamnose reductase
MLGHKMLQTLADEGLEVSTTVRSSADDLGSVAPFLTQYGELIDGVDAADFAQLEHVLKRLDPDEVVNCIGVVKQKPEASDHVTSITINALLPHQLYAWCRSAGSRLIHFSTDCVFDGSKGNYTEEDPSDAQDLYGRTKALGEVDERGALTLRTSIIGRELTSFRSLVEWFMSRRGGTVEGYARAIYTGLTTRQVARTVARVVTEMKDLEGLYQLAGPRISKFDLLSEINAQANLGVTLERNEDFALDRSLVGTSFEEATGVTAPSWSEMIADMIEDPTPYMEMR